jgi:hypothetical protein
MIAPNPARLVMAPLRVNKIRPDAVIRVFFETGNVIGTQRHAGAAVYVYE